jgi:tetratricopeptide (TPR) repeat protein
MLFKSLTLQQAISFGSNLFRSSLRDSAIRGISKRKVHILCACATLLSFAQAIGHATAQSADISSLEAYVDAIKQPKISDQIGSMEHFLQVSGQSTLRLDALEILVIDYEKMNDSERAVARAHDLLNMDPSNPLAVAVLNANGSTATSRRARNDEFAAARRGLSNVDLLHKPEGMSQTQFAQLQQRVRGMLAGSIGMGYLDQQDYEKATNYLQQALAADPGSPRYNYGLAQALLAGPNGGTADAYWLMARAVNMAKGTPNEQQIARDALRKYRENGGSEAVWNQLVAAAAASTPAANTSANTSTTPPGPAVTNSQAGTSTADSTQAAAASNPAQTPRSSAPSGSTQSNSAQSNSSAPVAQPVAPAQSTAAQPSSIQSTSNQVPANQGSGTASSPAQPSAAPQPVVAPPVVKRPSAPGETQPANNSPSGNLPSSNIPPINTPASGTTVQPQAANPPQTSANSSTSPGRVVAPSVTSTGATANAPVQSIGAPPPTNRNNGSNRTTPMVARASPPALPGGSSNVPESDQPILVSRPPITSTTPVGPTTAPLPDRKPAVAPPPVVTSPIMTAPTGPVSLGILIQTELLSGNNREPILEAMREMARNLRPGDEAFVMAFSNELDFEQDLTENDELLEEGLENLRPKPGAALFEGMTFAVQHLKRIGKNGNRVLLIISDGRNIPSSGAPQRLDADVSRVRIDCIGLYVDRPLDRQNLQKLSYWSGGMTSFVNDPEQIRTATSAIARTIVGEGFANR